MNPGTAAPGTTGAPGTAPGTGRLRPGSALPAGRPTFSLFSFFFFFSPFSHTHSLQFTSLHFTHSSFQYPHLPASGRRPPAITPHPPPGTTRSPHTHTPRKHKIARSYTPPPPIHTKRKGNATTQQSEAIGSNDRLASRRVLASEYSPRL